MQRKILVIIDYKNDFSEEQGPKIFQAWLLKY